MTEKNPYGQSKIRTVNVSVTIPADLIDWVRAEAKAYNVPISRVLAVIIRNAKDGVR